MDSTRLLKQSIIQGGKNRRRGKNENEGDKRELVFKEEGQGPSSFSLASLRLYAD